MATKSIALTDLQHNGRKLFNPSHLMPPYTEDEIRSVNFLNLLANSFSFMMGVCSTSADREERRAAKLIKRIVWLRDAEGRKNGTKIPSFKLQQFNMPRMFKALFPNRNPIECIGIIIDLAISSSDIKALLELTTFQHLMDDNDNTPAINTSLVYFIRCNSTNRIKIGRTRNSPEKRLAALSCGSSSALELLGVIYSNAEGYYHEIFAEHRVKGEWFDAHPHLMKFINDNVVPYIEN